MLVRSQAWLITLNSSPELLTGRSVTEFVEDQQVECCQLTFQSHRLFIIPSLTTVCR